MTINEARQLGRAKVAVLTFLENNLIVPKIYLDADWGGHHVDVLAIDRDGAGDVHAVLLFARRYNDGRLDLAEQEKAVRDRIERFQSIPANYKYIAAVDPEGNHDSVEFLKYTEESFFSPDFIGRIAPLLVTTREEEPKVELRLKPERFRAKIAKLADEYIQNHEADWEIRT